jgi:septum formation protein
MLQQEKPELILASASAARRTLLSAAGLRFRVAPARIDELAVRQSARAAGNSAEEAAMILAEMKARRIALGQPEALVIGADQILVCDETWFEKPGDMQAAREQLLRLRGRTHSLATAVVCQRDTQCVWRHVANPRVRMRDFTDAFLERYLAAEGESALTSVGAYRLESVGIHLFDQIVGDHSEILGLPLLPLLGFLRQHGVLSS